MGALRAFPGISEDESPLYDLTPKRAHLTMVRDDVFDTIGAELGGSALMVYMVLERRANAKGVCSPSYDTIAESLKVTRRHVINQMKRLSDAGYVQVEQRRGGDKGHLTNNFTLPHHPTKNDLTPSEPSSPPPSEQTANKGKNLVNVVHPPSERPSERPSEPSSPKVVVSSNEVENERDVPPKPFDLLAILCEEQGQDAAVLPKSEKNKQLGIAKRLIADDNLTADETQNLVRHLLGQKWVTNGVDFSLIENQLGKWRLGTGVRSTGNRKIFHSPKITDYKPEEWHILAYATPSTPEEMELSRQAAERVMG